LILVIEGVGPFEGLTFGLKVDDLSAKPKQRIIWSRGGLGPHGGGRGAAARGDGGVRCARFHERGAGGAPIPEQLGTPLQVEKLEGTGLPVTGWRQLFPASWRSKVPSCPEVGGAANHGPTMAKRNRAQRSRSPFCLSWLIAPSSVWRGFTWPPQTRLCAFGHARNPHLLRVRGEPHRACPGERSTDRKTSALLRVGRVTRGGRIARAGWPVMPRRRAVGQNALAPPKPINGQQDQDGVGPEVGGTITAGAVEQARASGGA
jgi:hypothetical protein